MACFGVTPWPHGRRHTVPPALSWFQVPWFHKSVQLPRPPGPLRVARGDRIKKVNNPRIHSTLRVCNMPDKSRGIASRNSYTRKSLSVLRVQGRSANDFSPTSHVSKSSHRPQRHTPSPPAYSLQTIRQCTLLYRGDQRVCGPAATPARRGAPTDVERRNRSMKSRANKVAHLELRTFTHAVIMHHAAELIMVSQAL